MATNMPQLFLCNYFRTSFTPSRFAPGGQLVLWTLSESHQTPRTNSKQVVTCLILTQRELHIHTNPWDSVVLKARVQWLEGFFFSTLENCACYVSDNLCSSKNSIKKKQNRQNWDRHLVTLEQVNVKSKNPLRISKIYKMYEIVFL